MKLFLAALGSAALLASTTALTNHADLSLHQDSWGGSQATSASNGAFVEQNNEATEKTESAEMGLKTIMINRHELSRVRVKGRINSQNIYTACQAKGLVPVCDHMNYDDGKCIVISTNWHLSHPHHLRRHKINEKFFVDAALYCGRGNRDKALVNNGHTHFWTNGQQKDIDTVCTSLPPPPKPIRWHGFLLQRVPIMGAATVDNMIKSCAAKKLKPVCDRKWLANSTMFLSLCSTLTPF